MCYLSCNLSLFSVPEHALHDEPDGDGAGRTPHAGHGAGHGSRLPGTSGHAANPTLRTDDETSGMKGMIYCERPVLIYSFSTVTT